MKKEVAHDLLKAGISIIPFDFKDPKANPPTYAYHGYPRDHAETSKPTPGLLQAKTALAACDAIPSEGSVRFILNGLTKVLSEPVSARQRVEQVVLPFLSHLHEQKKGAKLTKPHEAVYKKLLDATVEVYLSLSSPTAKLSFDQQSVDSFFLALLWHNNNKMFFTMYVSFIFLSGCQLK